MKKIRLALLSLVTLATSLTSFGQAGTGWTPIPWTSWGVNTSNGGTRKVHLEKTGTTRNQNWIDESKIYYYNTPGNPQGTYEYRKDTSTEIFRHYGTPANSINRSEIRVQDDYNSGQARQLEGYVTFNEKLSADQAFLQIWGHSDAGATMLQLRGKGGRITGAGRITRNLNPAFPVINYSNREFKLNVIHRQETRNGLTIISNGRIEVYIDGILFLWINDNKISDDSEYIEGANYFKYGCYGTVESSLGDAQVIWKEARYFRGGNFPGTTAQSLTFPALPPVSLSGGDVTPGAFSTSALPVSYRSDNPAVARIVDGKIRPVSEGTAKIWAYQDGNGTYAPAPVRTQTITVGPGGGVQSQSINFPSLPAKLASDVPFTLTATATSGLPVSYSSDKADVATISGSTVTIVGAGTANITASQAGGGGFQPAPPVVRQLVVNPATVAVNGVSVAPTSLSLTVGATGALTATVSPVNATTKSVTWSSSAPAVATVSSSGVVTAQSVGSATISARTTDGNLTASAAVTVTSIVTPPGDATPITASFIKDGSGQFYWVLSEIPGKYLEFNSWNLKKLEINGVDFTNKWASTQAGISAARPVAINGQYFIRYDGAYAWSHFEVIAKP